MTSACRERASSCSLGHTIRARCRSRCPPPRVHMAAMRGMEVVGAAARGLRAAAADHGQGRRAAAPPAARCARPSDRDEALDGRAGGVCEGMGCHRCITAMRRRMPRLRADAHGLVRARRLVREHARRLPARCTACRCGATSRSPTRCSTARAASCSGKPTTACRRRWPCSIALLKGI